MSAYDDLKKRAEELKDERCHAFPHIICNEVQGLHPDNWCEPCMARAVLKCLPEKPEKPEKPPATKD